MMMMMMMMKKNEKLKLKTLGEKHFLLLCK